MTQLDYLTLESMIADLGVVHEVALSHVKITSRSKGITHSNRWIVASAQIERTQRRWYLNLHKDPNKPNRLIHILKTYMVQVTGVHVVSALPDGLTRDLEKGQKPAHATTDALVALQYINPEGVPYGHIAYVTPHESEILRLFLNPTAAVYERDYPWLPTRVTYQGFTKRLTEIVQGDMDTRTLFRDENTHARHEKNKYEQEVQRILRSRNAALATS